MPSRSLCILKRDLVTLNNKNIEIAWSHASKRNDKTEQTRKETQREKIKETHRDLHDVRQRACVVMVARVRTQLPTAALRVRVYS